MIADGGHRDAFHPDAPDPACPECQRLATEKSPERSAQDDYRAALARVGMLHDQTVTAVIASACFLALHPDQEGATAPPWLSSWGYFQDGWNARGSFAFTDRDRIIRIRGLLASRHLVDSQNRCITCWVFPDGAGKDGHSPSCLRMALLEILDSQP